MALDVTPSFDKWNQQSDAFVAIFKAFDDKGNKCKGNKFYVEYSITYDGTMPDLTSKTKIISDGSGLVILTIAMPCVISVFGSYAHDVNDIEKGFVTQELGVNYQITFQPIILGINATYTGPNIEITDDYNIQDVIIQASMSDRSVQMIDVNQCVIDNLNIDKIGNNTRVISYNDTSLGVVWTAEFSITGIAKLLYIESYYTGHKRVIGDRIFPYDVAVDGVYLTGPETQEKIPLTEKQWYFADIPIINELNNGVITIGYNKKTATITVPYESTTFLRLNVWYEGDKIEVGSSYNPQNLAIYLVYPDEPDKIRITYKDCVISSHQVTEEGWNWFTATYNYGFRQVKQWFPVFGFIRKKYIDLDFKVVYVDEVTKQETDYTDTFKQAMTFQDILCISWEEFLKKVNELNKYGLYVMTVPKGKGLSNQYDTDWEVLCIDNTTLRAGIKYFYEEEQNG